MCLFPSSPGEHKSKRIKFNAAMTASESSTIAEEVVVLLRRLHPLPAWNDLINKFIGSSLQCIPNIIMFSAEDQSDSATSTDSKAQVGVVLWMHVLCTFLSTDID